MRVLKKAAAPARTALAVTTAANPNCPMSEKLKDLIKTPSDEANSRSRATAIGDRWARRP